jgi:hypothetical protein
MVVGACGEEAAHPMKNWKQRELGRDWEPSLREPFPPTSPATQVSTTSQNSATSWEPIFQYMILWGDISYLNHNRPQTDSHRYSYSLRENSIASCQTFHSEGSSGKQTPTEELSGLQNKGRAYPAAQRAAGGLAKTGHPWACPGQ